MSTRNPDWYINWYVVGIVLLMMLAFACVLRMVIPTAAEVRAAKAALVQAEAEADREFHRVVHQVAACGKLKSPCDCYRTVAHIGLGVNQPFMVSLPDSRSVTFPSGLLELCPQ